LGSYNGLIIINKEAGFTSSDVVTKLRGILHMKKIGHTGTLDPDAVGVLPVCLGNGTKLVQMLMDHDKVYEAVCRLGVRTDTQDMSGTVLKEIPDDEVARRLAEQAQASALSILELLSQTAEGFTGNIMQTAPMYSAVKVGGKRLYEIAREGKVVERTPRPVQVFSIRITGIDLPRFTMQVHCGKGTYIRTLCSDIGDALGTGGAMEHLTRLRVGSCTIDEAHTLGEIETIMKTDPDGVLELIRLTDSFFADAPGLIADGAALILLKNGNRIPASLLRDVLPAEGAERYRMYDADGRFYAVYAADRRGGDLIPEKMFIS